MPSGLAIQCGPAARPVAAACHRSAGFSLGAAATVFKDPWQDTLRRLGPETSAVPFARVERAMRQYQWCDCQWLQAAHADP